jgi:hypothetical protein
MAQQLPQIMILLPPQGYRVRWRQLIFGAASEIGLPMQVLVRDRNGLWWPQQNVNFVGSGLMWSAMVQFGKDEASSLGEKYQIVAVPGTGIKDLSSELPADPGASNVVEVVRA